MIYKAPTSIKNQARKQHGLTYRHIVSLVYRSLNILVLQVVNIFAKFRQVFPPTGC